MENKKRSISTKTFAILLAVMLVIGCMAGGTIAWLFSTSNEVENTFTYGDVNITLTETTGANYTIVPGVDITKDPKVTVDANSVDCYLFVKVTKDTFAEAVSWNPADGWTELEEGVYYREVSKNSAAQDFSVIKDNKITVANTLTKDEINKLGNKSPKLTFKAYAIQKAGFDTPAAAWAEADK